MAGTIQVTVSTGRKPAGTVNRGAEPSAPNPSPGRKARVAVTVPPQRTRRKVPAPAAGVNVPAMRSGSLSFVIQVMAVRYPAYPAPSRVGASRWCTVPSGRASRITVTAGASDKGRPRAVIGRAAVVQVLGHGGR